MQTIENWTADFGWSSQFDQQAYDLLSKHLPEIFCALRSIVQVREASPELDRSQATDIRISWSPQVALRVRASTRFRDLTIRAGRISGHATELDKLLAGYCDLYFYGWLDDYSQLSEYIIVDLHRLRRVGLLSNQKLIHNPSGETSFIAIDYQTLSNAGCIVAGVVRNKQWDGTQWTSMHKLS